MKNKTSQEGFGDPEYKHQLLHEAGQIVNELIHSEIKRLQRYEQVTWRPLVS